MIKSLFTKTNVLLFFIMLGSVLWLLPAFCPGGYDREIFRFIGRSIKDGFIPYKDTFDHKPPFIYFIFLVCSPLGEWDIFIPSTFFLLLSVYLIRKLIPQNFRYWSVLIPIFLIVWLRNPVFYEYGGLTREYSAYLYCIFFYCFHLNKKSNWLVFIIGVVFINQQNDILPLFPFLFYKLYQERGYSIANILKLFAIFLIPFIFISAWLLAHNSLSMFIHQAFGFNFQYYSHPLYQLKIFYILNSIIIIFTKFKFLMVGILILFFQVIWSKNRSLSLSIIISILACFYNISISGRFYGHYFLPLGPILVYAYLFVISEKHQSKIKIQMTVAGILICYFSVIWQNRTFNLTQQITNAKNQIIINNQIEIAIEKELNHIDYIYFIHSMHALDFNMKYKKRPPTKYVNFNIWDEIPAWDKDLHEFQNILDSLDNKRILVFDFTEKYPFRRQDMNEQLSIKLKKHFSKIGKINNVNGQMLFNIYLSNIAEDHK